MEGKLTIVFVICILVLGFMWIIFFGLFLPSQNLNSPDNLELKKRYKVNLYIEDNVILDKKSETAPADIPGIDHYFALPCSITINGEKYYTYVYMNDGAYTNYKENNKYSWNNQKNSMIFIAIDNKTARLNFENWTNQKQIQEKYLLKYGFDN